MLGFVVKPQNMLEFKFMNENKLSYYREINKFLFKTNEQITLLSMKIDYNLEGSSYEKKVTPMKEYFVK